MESEARITSRNRKKIELRRWITVLFASTAVCVITGLIITLLLPKVYEARASIFVEAQSSGLPSSIAKIASVSTKTGDPGNYAVAILNSESFAKQIVEKLQLLDNPTFNPDRKLNLDLAAGKLRKNVRIADDRTGLIQVSVGSQAPKLAADIANEYLTTFLERVDTASKRKRLYTKDKIDQLRDELKSLQLKAKSLRERTRVVNLDEQSRAVINKIALLEQKRQDIKTNLDAVNSQLNTVGDLDQLASLKSRKAALAAQLSALDASVGQAKGELDAFPDVELEMARLEQEIKLKTKLFEEVSAQHELALISEQGELSVYKIVDRASIPQKKSRPRLIVNLALALVLGIAIGVAANLIISDLQADD